jgi:hypothetical protein
MDSETSSLLILIAIIAAAILVPLVLIGTLVLIFLPVVRKRRQNWQAAAATLGLQCDRASMWGTRELPVRIFWQVHGQSVGQLDMTGAVLAGRHDMRGGRAGLRYVFCQAMLQPPLGLGLSVTHVAANSLPNAAARTAFESAFVLSARDTSRAQDLFRSAAGELFAKVAESGWRVSATDDYVQVILGGDYAWQFPEKEPERLSAALETAVMCGRHLLAARRNI